MKRPPQFDEVWRDTKSGVVVMWVALDAALIRHSRTSGTCIVLSEEGDADLGPRGDIGYGISWIYRFWERLDQ